VIQKVSVIGAGRMGSALALALYHKGFRTTVWTRTAAKLEPLSRLGLAVAGSLLEAVEEADVVVVNINDYSATLHLLQEPGVEFALRGKILVQLTSGPPKEAREMEAWARRSGISYLDGAILSYPKGIGTPACTVVYSGPEQVFNLAKPVLMAFGDAPLFVGNEIGHASAFDIAALTFLMSAMVGFLQGYVVCERGGPVPRELPAEHPRFATLSARGSHRHVPKNSEEGLQRRSSDARSLFRAAQRTVGLVRGSKSGPQCRGRLAWPPG
jgi:3-hydroxyisobutyrate dehydrogenase-like beta-hydroxyacid dehydrogenase